MIWFTCQQCQRRHGRPESDSGSLIFCECGHGNTVPWESTAEPEPAVAVELLPPAPELAPVKFAVEVSPTRPSSAAPARPPAVPPRRSERGWSGEAKPRTRRDPSICLHHKGVPSKGTCADCKNGFCQDCLVTVQGDSLCAPCKNLRVRALHQPWPTSQLALVSLLLALFTGPLAFLLLLPARGFNSPRLSLWALGPGIAAIVLGFLALRNIRNNRKLGGLSLALSAIATAAFAVFWTVFLVMYAGRFQGG